MKIKKIHDYSFFVLINKKENEVDKEYLSRVRNCLGSFVDENCNDWALHPLQLSNKDLTLENMWTNMSFKNVGKLPKNTIGYCDVKFQIYLDRFYYDGINIWAHRKYGTEKDRKFWVDFLYKKWENFDYSFN